MAEAARNRIEQVLTSRNTAPGEIIEPLQQLAMGSPPPQEGVNSYYVLGIPYAHQEGRRRETGAAEEAVASAPSRRTVSRKPPKRGGWGSPTSIPWERVKEAFEIDHAARRAGKALNLLVTLRMPPDATEQEGKREICRAIGHLGQALKRRGVDHLGITTYEKRPGALLHAHHLVHVPKKHLEVLETFIANISARFGDPYAADYRPADRAAVGYVTKQRQVLPPDMEATIRHRRQKGAAITGSRISFTVAAKDLLR